MSTSGSKSNEHVAHFLVDIHNEGDEEGQGQAETYCGDEEKHQGEDTVETGGAEF